MIQVRTYDRWILFAALSLASFGALMVYSSTSVVAPGSGGASESYLFRKHLLTALLGLVAMYAAYRAKPAHIRKLAVASLIVSFLLLVLVFVDGVGVSAGGARRWIRLWPSTFQPSEFVKLAMVVFLARYMSSPWYRADRFSHFALPVAVMLLFQVVFIKQPDFGATMSLGVLTLFMLFISGARLRYIFYLVAIGSPAVAKLAMEPYRLKRLTAFLDPWKDARGAGFQLVQSFIAFGRGGLTGVGLGKSRQKLDFLPEVHTDFIFSMVGEEMGFIVASLVVLLFALLFWRGVKAARGAGDAFAYYLTFGVSMMLALQALVNFAVVTGMLPTKGLPLPFLSYGGSSLLVSMVSVGLLLNFSSHGAVPEPEEDGLEVILRRKKAKRSVYGGAR